VPRRFLATVVTLPLILGLVTMAPTRAQPGVGPCDLTARSGESVHHFMRRRITCSVNRYGPVGGGASRAICIAKRESGLDPRAESDTGMYLGLYQQSAKMWPDRYKAWTRRVWHLSKNAKNGRSNAIVTIRMVHAAGGWKDAGWRVKGC
jgi:hypothetical protein